MSETSEFNKTEKTKENVANISDRSSYNPTPFTTENMATSTEQGKGQKQNIPLQPSIAQLLSRVNYLNFK